MKALLINPRSKTDSNLLKFSRLTLPSSRCGCLLGGTLLFDFLLVDLDRLCSPYSVQIVLNNLNLHVSSGRRGCQCSCSPLGG
jgi:hypothetical protein